MMDFPRGDWVHGNAKTNGRVWALILDFVIFYFSGYFADGCKRFLRGLVCEPRFYMRSARHGGSTTFCV